MTDQVIDEEVCISAPISIVWDALTNPNITEQYWGGGTRIESDWRKGSTVFYRRDGEIVDKHELLEIVPNRFIEHTFKPMFGEFKGESPSLVSIILTEEDLATRVTVFHRNFQHSSKVYTACSSGWPTILSSLKALLENENHA